MNIFLTNYLLSLTVASNNLDWFDESDYMTMNIFDSFYYKLKEISTYGFTIEEFQRALIILCLVRFLIYSFRYNLITSFKICSIGLISCILWAMALNDCIGAYYPNLSLHPLLRNAYREEIIYREVAQYRAAERVFDDLIKQTNSPYNFDWITPIFAKIPETITHITDPIYVFIRKDLVSTLSTIYKTNIKPMSSMFLYVGWVRVGKKYFLIMFDGILRLLHFIILLCLIFSNLPFVLGLF